MFCGIAGCSVVSQLFIGMIGCPVVRYVLCDSSMFCGQRCSLGKQDVLQSISGSLG